MAPAEILGKSGRKIIEVKKGEGLHGFLPNGSEVHIVGTEKGFDTDWENNSAIFPEGNYLQLADGLIAKAVKEEDTRE